MAAQIEQISELYVEYVRRAADNHPILAILPARAGGRVFPPLLSNLIVAMLQRIMKSKVQAVVERFSAATEPLGYPSVLSRTLNAEVLVHALR